MPFLPSQTIKDSTMYLQLINHSKYIACLSKSGDLREIGEADWVGVVRWESTDKIITASNRIQHGG
jgi:hypothetical protein